MKYALEDVAMLFVGSFAMSLFGELCGRKTRVSNPEKIAFITSITGFDTRHFWDVNHPTPGATACNLRFDEIGFPLDPKQKMAELSWETIESVCPEAAKEVSSMALLQIQQQASKVLLCSAIYSVTVQF